MCISVGQAQLPCSTLLQQHSQAAVQQAWMSSHEVLLLAVAPLHAQVLHDTYRIQFYHAYLNNACQVIEQYGLNVKKMFAWTFLDNFECGSAWLWRARRRLRRLAGYSCIMIMVALYPIHPSCRRYLDQPSKTALLLLQGSRAMTCHTAWCTWTSSLAA
jgi:hypothetical protein